MVLYGGKAVVVPEVARQEGVLSWLAQSGRSVEFLAQTLDSLGYVPYFYLVLQALTLLLDLERYLLFIHANRR